MPRIYFISFCAYFILCTTSSFSQDHTGCDTLFKVENSFEHPYNLICQLETKRRKWSSLWLCRKYAHSTGFFIRPNVILTNAHNVESNMFTQVEWIRVNPGRDLGENAQNSFTVNKRRNVRKIVALPKEYTFFSKKTTQKKIDYALIFLGDYTSEDEAFFETEVADSAKHFGKKMFILGYPGAIRVNGKKVLKGKEQYITTGDIDTMSTRNIGYQSCTWGGNSGSPVIFNDEGTLKVIGVHGYPKAGVRLTAEVLARINNWIEEFEAEAEQE